MESLGKSPKQPSGGASETPDRVKGKRAAMRRGNVRVTPVSFQDRLVQVRKKRAVIQTDRET